MLTAKITQTESEATLFVCEWAPNGTNDLLSLDENGFITEKEEALFGVNVSVEDQGAVYMDKITGEFVSPEELKAENADYSDYILMRPISKIQALRKICVSPVSDGSSTVSFIKSIK